MKPWWRSKKSIGGAMKQKKYKEVRCRDLSYYYAKRYHIGFILDEVPTKDDMKEIILAEVERWKGIVFHQNGMSEKHWGNKLPDVIWLDFLAKESDSVYSCRALWVSDHLESMHRPLDLYQVNFGMGDIETYEDIQIAWRDIWTKSSNS